MNSEGRIPLLSKGTLPDFLNQIFAFGFKYGQASHYKVNEASSFSSSSHPEFSTSKPNSKSFQVVYLLPFLWLLSTYSQYICISDSFCQATDDFHGTQSILILFDLSYYSIHTADTPFFLKYLLYFNLLRQQCFLPLLQLLFVFIWP